MGKKDYCCIAGCSNSKQKRPELDFYAFSSDKNLNETWIVKVRKDLGPSFNPGSTDTKVCGDQTINVVSLV